jgi:hypothetical protein
MFSVWLQFSIITAWVIATSLLLPRARQLHASAEAGDGARQLMDGREKE